MMDSKPWIVKSQNGAVAILSTIDGKWRSKDSEFARQLEIATSMDTMSSSEPDSQRWQVERAIRLLRVQVVQEGDPPDFDPNVVY